MSLGEDFYANRLGTEKRAIYDAYYAELQKKEFSGQYCYLIPENSSGRTLNSAIEALSALAKDHPEFFFLPNEVTKRGNRLYFDNLSFYSRVQIKRIRALLERELFSLTTETMHLDAWEKEKVVYERVASAYQYKKHDEIHDYNVTGPLLREEGVCSGYVSMFILALRRVGIPCHRVSGGGHAWVMAYINDIPVHCDVTWESHEGVNSLNYTYFNLTSEEISRDHDVPFDQLPKCCFSGYSYHRKKSCYFTSAREAEKYIRSSLIKGELPVRIKTSPDLNVSEIVLKGIRMSLLHACCYSINEKQSTAIIFKNKEVT